MNPFATDAWSDTFATLPPPTAVTAELHSKPRSKDCELIATLENFINNPIYRIYRHKNTLYLVNYMFNTTQEVTNLPALLYWFETGQYLDADFVGHEADIITI